MRRRILLALLLAPAPLAAQMPRIAPAPSALFAANPISGTPTDSSAYQGPSVVGGALMGGLGGMLFGFGLAKVVEAKSPCGCDDPGLDRAVSYGLTGLIVGAVVGGVLARRK